MLPSYLLCKKLTSGTLADDEIIAILQEISERGETIDDLVGMAQYLREQAIRVPLPGVETMDVCGTGGSGHKRMNTSTTVAFILATLGVPVAKHGNRASSGLSGSFDVLEALGVPVTQSPFVVASTIKKLGLGFMFAPAYHPLLKTVGAARKKYGKRTIFNLLGPLVNPAMPHYQLIGATTPHNAETIAKAAIALGSTRVTVVCGEDGLDDITLTGDTTIYTADKNGLTKNIFHPRDLGIEAVTSFSEIQGGNATENAREMIDLFSGKGKSHLHSLVCLNTAFALTTYHPNISLREGYNKADSILRSGAVLRFFYDYKALAQQLNS